MYLGRSDSALNAGFPERFPWFANVQGPLSFADVGAEVLHITGVGDDIVCAPLLSSLTQPGDCRILAS
jgi:hypothetical protein